MREKDRKKERERQISLSSWNFKPFLLPLDCSVLFISIFPFPLTLEYILFTRQCKGENTFILFPSLFRSVTLGNRDKQREGSLESTSTCTCTSWCCLCRAGINPIKDIWNCHKKITFHQKSATLNKNIVICHVKYINSLNTTFRTSLVLLGQSFFYMISSRPISLQNVCNLLYFGNLTDKWVGQKKFVWWQHRIIVFSPTGKEWPLSKMSADHLASRFF